MRQAIPRCKKWESDTLVLSLKFLLRRLHMAIVPNWIVSMDPIDPRDF